MERVEANNSKGRALGRTWFKILKSPVVIGNSLERGMRSQELKYLRN